jgi:4-oxalocrotonate tautomerase
VRSLGGPDTPGPRADAVDGDDILYWGFERRDGTMPHVIVKMLAGRSEQQKAKIADDVTKAIVIGANVGEDAVSVSIEDVAEGDWVERVYKPDVLGNPDRLYKKPGYDPL